MFSGIVLSGVLALAASDAPFTLAAETVSVQDVRLLQPDSVLHERGADAAHLAQYLRAAEAMVGTTLRDEKPTPAAGFIVFAVREGYASKVWFDLKPPLPAAVAAKLAAALEHLKEVPFVGGTIVFALNVRLWGAAADTREMPRPQAWIDTAKGVPVEIGELVDRAWPRPVAQP